MRVLRVVLVVALLAVGVVLGRAAPAAAADPTVVLSSATVVEDQVVTLTIEDFSPGFVALVLCTADIRDDVTQSFERCGVAENLALPGDPPPSVEWSVTSTITTVLGTRQIACRTEPGGCVLGVMSFSEPSPTLVIDAAFVDLVYGPSLVGTPSRRLADGDTVAVSGVDLPAGNGWSVAQCARALLDDPTPANAAALCGPSTPVTAGAGGAYGTDLVVHDPLVPGGSGPPGAPVACGAAGCIVALLAPGGSGGPGGPGGVVANSIGLSFGSTTTSLTPDEDIVSGTPVTLTVDGAPRNVDFFMTCLTPVGPEVDDERCGTVEGSLTVDPAGHGEGVFTAQVDPLQGGDTPLDCRADPCAIVAFDDQLQTVFESPVLDFAPPPTLALDPTTGVLEGQTIALQAANLAPSAPYVAELCSAPGVCAGGGLFWSAPDGTLPESVLIGQRLAHGPQYGYCRANCTIAVEPSNFPGERTNTVGFAMATGTSAAAPSTGLVDGQEIRVTGDQLMPSYPGPTLGIFPTGGWALTQCDRAVLDDLTLGGVFAHCAAPPVTRGVTIPGPESTMDEPFVVRSSITRILGGTTDCTTAPDACVVGLVRFEQDASLSHHLTPITFGP